MLIRTFSFVAAFGWAFNSPLMGAMTDATEWQDIYRLESRQAPPSLKSFWLGIDPRWLPVRGAEFPAGGRDRSLAYLEIYARRHEPEKVLPGMVRDAHSPRDGNTMVRTMLYSWVVLKWTPAVTRKIIEPYLESKVATERGAAEDFLAEVEQIEKEGPKD